MAEPTFEVTITNARLADEDAARWAVGRENDRRAELNPAGTPLPITPAATLVASYQVVLQQMIASNHLLYRDESAYELLTDNNAIQRWRNSSAAQRSAALAEMASLRPN